MNKSINNLSRQSYTPFPLKMCLSLQDSLSSMGQGSNKLAYSPEDTVNPLVPTHTAQLLKMSDGNKNDFFSPDKWG